jgi:hypothetical protein
MNRRKEWRGLIGPRGAEPVGWLGRVLSYAATLALLGVALMFSAVIFAVLALLGLLVGGWFWWKTRALRRELARAGYPGPARQREPDPESASAGGIVIDGDVRRVDDEAERLTAPHERRDG